MQKGRGAGRKYSEYLRGYKYKSNCLYGQNAKQGCVKVPQKIFGWPAVVKVTFKPQKYFYGAPKNGARGP